MWTLALTTLAFAEPSTSDAPLAIPAGRPPPAGGHRAPGGRRAPQVDEAYVAALDTYRRERLRLRPYETFSYSSTGGWVGWGGWGPGWGWGVGFPTVWVDTAHRVGIYEGADRLDVPAALRALDEPERAAGLDRRIRKNRTWSDVGTAVGVVGVLGTLTCLVGSQTTYDPYLSDQWMIGTVASTAAMAGGFVFAGFPGTRAERLQFDPSATFEPGELESDVSAHNDALARDLGLTPADTARLGD
jgi:hypothetical protein